MKSRFSMTDRSSRRIFEAILIGALLITACGGSTAAPASPRPSPLQYASLTINGLLRTYRLYLPPSLDLKQPAPLVVAMPGCPMNSDDLAELSSFDNQAKTAGFIVVYPDHLDACWNAGSCCSIADDVPFIGALLDRLASDFRIDARLTFVAGFSAGAMMAYRLACEMSGRITAIASVSGAMVLDACRPTRPVSVLEMHGTDDPIVPYKGGVVDDTGSSVAPIASTIERWVTFDGCSRPPTQTVTGITKTSVWAGCQGGTVVRFDTVSRGVHRWFGETIDPVPGEPDSTSEIWRFFSSLTPGA